MNQSVRAQIRSRAVFPTNVWRTAASVTRFRHDPQDICKIIAKEYGWPNHHFIPNDPLDFLFLPMRTGLESRWTDSVEEEINRLRFSHNVDRLQLLLMHLPGEAFRTTLDSHGPNFD